MWNNVGETVKNSIGKQNILIQPAQSIFLSFLQLFKVTETDNMSLIPS